MRQEWQELRAFFADPLGFRRARPHKVWSWTWIALAIPGILWWKESIMFVMLVSLWANWETSNGADEAQQAKIKAQEAEEDVSGQ